MLTQPQAYEEIQAFWRACDVAGDTTTLAATVMPDHVHWLFTLGRRLSLGRVLAKFKSKATSVLADSDAEWQRDFFEHRLRDHESTEAYGFYVFMNPYRARLVDLTRGWPGWFCPDVTAFRFGSALLGGRLPPREWLELPEDESLNVGE